MSTQFTQPQFGATAPAPQGPHPTVDYGQPGGQQQMQTQPQGRQFGPPQQSGPPQGYQGYDPSMIPPMPQQQQGQWQSPAQRPPANYQGQQGTGWSGQPGYGYQQPQFQQPPGYGQQPGQSAPPQQPYAPQGYAQPQPQPHMQQSQGFDPNVVLRGPNVPQELQGRTWGQAMQIYNQLAADYLRRRDAQGSGYSQVPQGQPQPNGQQQGFQPPRQGQQGQQGQQQTGTWRDDIRQEVQQAIGPVVQYTTRQQAEETKKQVAATISDWNELAQDVERMLASADPSSLTNPAVWESAADLARGKRARTMQQNGQQGGPQLVQTPYGMVLVQTQQPVPQAPYGQPPQYGNGQQTYQGQQGYVMQQGGPMASVPAQQAPLPQYQFFTEGPTPPMMNVASNVLSPYEREIARKFGMDDATYLAWKGGVVR